MKNALFSTSSSEWQPEKFKFVEDVVHSKPLSCPSALRFSKLLELNITKRLRAMKAKVWEITPQQNCVTLVTVTSAQEQNHLKTSFILCTQKSKGQPKILKAVVWLKLGRLGMFSEGTLNQFNRNTNCAFANAKWKLLKDNPLQPSIGPKIGATGDETVLKCQRGFIFFTVFYHMEII